VPDTPERISGQRDAVAPRDPATPRDLIGYGADPPRVAWPGGALLALNFVLNYEEGSEYALGDGDGRSETALTEVAAPRVPVGERDLGSESMYEYGSRAGFWRIARLFAGRKVPLTVFGCAQALERNPGAAAFIRDADWDVCCHGWRWVEHYKLSESEEREHIARAVASLQASIGQRPLGWYCRYAPSVRTRRLLLEEGGFLYDSDAYNDDLPYWVRVDGRAHLIVPYSLVTNDVKLMNGLVTADQFCAALKDACEVLVAEGRDRPKMMSIGMHPRLLGHPTRFAGLARFIEYVAGRRDIWLARRIDIARSWMAQFPAG
jgi:peptidoglycan/xylan/chitin deacetylase (PgdA/CDA1 family)